MAHAKFIFHTANTPRSGGCPVTSSRVVGALFPPHIGSTSALPKSFLFPVGHQLPPRHSVSLSQSFQSAPFPLPLCPRDASPASLATQCPQPPLLPSTFSCFSPFPTAQLSLPPHCWPQLHCSFVTPFSSFPFSLQLLCSEDTSPSILCPRARLSPLCPISLAGCQPSVLRFPSFSPTDVPQCLASSDLLLNPAGLCIWLRAAGLSRLSWVSRRRRHKEGHGQANASPSSRASRRIVSAPLSSGVFARTAASKRICFFNTFLKNKHRIALFIPFICCCSFSSGLGTDCERNADTLQCWEMISLDHAVTRSVTGTPQLYTADRWV